MASEASFEISSEDVLEEDATSSISYIAPFLAVNRAAAALSMCNFGTMRDASSSAGGKCVDDEPYRSRNASGCFKLLNATTQVTKLRLLL